MTCLFFLLILIIMITIITIIILLPLSFISLIITLFLSSSPSSSPSQPMDSPPTGSAGVVTSLCVLAEEGVGVAVLGSIKEIFGVDQIRRGDEGKGE